MKLWHDLLGHLELLRGVEVTQFVTDGVVGSWIDFTFRGQRFTINEEAGFYHFFVEEPDCSGSVLNEVAAHCEKFLRL